MSKQAFDDFIRKLQQDVDLQRELKERFGSPEAGVAATDLSGFAAAKGYQFAVEDISSELDDEALSAVAGGVTSGLNSFLKIEPFLKFDSLYLKIDDASYKF